MFFVDKLLSSYKSRRGAGRQAGLNAAIELLPERVTSSVWRIRGLNPHSDTPVEILHVVLLGFVKYLWRDVVKNQIHDKPDKKAILSARLSSVWVEGLGLDSLLAGNTLVNYCGSLTGGDFRKLAQVAPFVLHGLPEIRDLNSHIATIEREIQNFLVLAAKWSIRWFNKPKFHILVHLPAHIRRFGPAALFATETFESFNAIIREKSVHSNRHAPSHDLAVAFAAGNRIRHLTSGGKFLQVGELTEMWTEVEKKAETDFENASLSQAQRVTRVQRYFRKLTAEKRHWKSIGPGPRHLLGLSKDTIGRYLGLTVSKRQKLKERAHMCKFDKSAPSVVFSATETGRRFPDAELFASEVRQSSVKQFRMAKEVFLANGDRCSVSTEPILRRDKQKFSSASPFVIVRRREQPLAQDTLNSGVTVQQSSGAATLYVARATEILQHLGDAPSIAVAKHASSVLAQLYSTSLEPSVSGMPRLTARDDFMVFQPTDVLCTVNVQHDCIRNKCEVKDIHFRRQERQATSLRKGTVEHAGNLQDLVLNTAQMRDAIYVQRFRIPPKLLNVDQTLMESARKEVDFQNQSKKSRRPKQTLRPNGPPPTAQSSTPDRAPPPAPQSGVNAGVRNPSLQPASNSSLLSHSPAGRYSVPGPSQRSHPSRNIHPTPPLLHAQTQTGYINTDCWSPAPTPGAPPHAPYPDLAHYDDQAAFISRPVPQSIPTYTQQPTHFSPDPLAQ